MAQQKLDVTNYDLKKEGNLKILADFYDTLAPQSAETSWLTPEQAKNNNVITAGKNTYYGQGSFDKYNPLLSKSILEYKSNNSMQKRSLNQGIGGAASVLGGTVN